MLKKVLKVLIITSLAVGGVFGLFIVGIYAMIGLSNSVEIQKSQEPVSSSYQAEVPAVTQDPTLLEIASTVGATDVSNLNLHLVNSLDDGNYGFYRENDIYILNSLSYEQKKTGFAHEYLHYVWYKKLDEPTKAALTSDLMALYGQDRQIQERLTPYVKSGELNASELLSFYCTESSDRWLIQRILDTCNSNINRSTLTFYR